MTALIGYLKNMFYTHFRVSIVISFFIIAFAPLMGQEYTDTIKKIVNKGDTINLSLVWFPTNHGNIQWQYLLTNEEWSDLPGADSKSFVFSIDTTARYRAEVLSGTCDPVYSKLTFLQVLDLKTIKTDSVNENHAVVYCSVSTGDIGITEKGILLDTKSYPDQYSVRIKDTTVNNSFTIRLDGLDTGKSYYVRCYVITAEGKYVYGNIRSFSTLQIKWIDRININDTSAQIFYTISSTPDPSENGVFYSTEPGTDTTSLRVTGNFTDGRYNALIKGLADASVYYVVPYMKVNGRYWLADEREVKTFWDYSREVVDTSAFTINHRIIWNDPSTARKISQDGYFAEYGRVCRLGTSDTLLLVYHGGPNNGDWVDIMMRKSFNNGVTWTNQQILMNINDYLSSYWRFCNPELLELDNGWILLAYTANGKPETNENCEVHILTSKDRGLTWEGPLKIVTGRSWEPVIRQFQHGELELFYSSEARWWPGDNLEQEIHSIRSTDNGKTWSWPEIAAYYPGKRDGMPVPVILQGNKGVIFSIECVNYWLSPWIIRRDLAGEWSLPDPILSNGPTRWSITGFSGFGGAPYMIQLPSGEIVLSVHTGGVNDWKKSHMEVMIGDNTGHNFGYLELPWGSLPVNEGAIMNSLFLKDNQTIVAISSRNMADGSGSIWWLEGAIVED
jgi:hypothetical protein